ncbi:MAG: hypothetical protein QN152_02725 [Armatimonadota bacterium]|nr:hypothetical protein [Armatimonadota bacterium]MDR7465128.1 hypothetical protein [Armatimonadota bacterium]MDR7473401.1 hypothetical protein [Armatimonadota bacterium]MDR7538430.1 hypothetical protein [Armatimonadota bacterium]
MWAIASAPVWVQGREPVQTPARAKVGARATVRVRATVTARAMAPARGRWK